MTREERLLLARVNRHLRAETRAGRIRMRSGRHLLGEHHVAGYDSDGLTVYARDRADQPFPEWPDTYRANSITEAVDIAVAVGLLPATFSSAYWVGVRDSTAVTA